MNNTSITKMKGDATLPVSPKVPTYIMHCCNDINRWGKGFVVPLGIRYPEARVHFLRTKSSLGDCQVVSVWDNLWVANLIGQHTIWRDKSGNPPIRYDALSAAMLKLAHTIQQTHGSSPVIVQFPLLGCGLAGGEWSVVETIILNAFSQLNNVQLILLTP